MVHPTAQDARLREIRLGQREPATPADTVEAQFPWLLPIGGVIGGLTGIGITQVPIIGDFFGGGNGDGGDDTVLLALLAVVVLLLLVVAMG